MAHEQRQLSSLGSRSRALIGLVALLASSGTLAAQPADPAAVVAAERAFAADTQVMGIPRGFLKHSARDAIQINRGVTRTHEAIKPDAPLAPPTPSLFWFPIWAGIARSGDLGFTSGPVEVGGRRAGTYFTIWQRQPDGSWKWVYDGGLGASSAGDPGPERAPVFLPLAASAGPSAPAAFAEVRQAEAALAAEAAGDQRAAHLARYAAEGRLHIAPHPPARTPEAVRDLLTQYPARLRFGTPMGGTASAAGDLAWTYGPVEGQGGADAFKGHYLHVWQKQPAGWRLVFSQILTGEPPPSPGG
jgi:ketosteroid isomerase-like protein